MIRHFSGFFKRGRYNFSDVEIFSRALSSFHPQTARCPGCGALGSLSFHASYQRDLISYDRGVSVNALWIDRYLCGSCGATHAALPEVLVPFGSYSLFFVLTVVKAYYCRALTNLTVRQLCAKFQIATSTLYVWKDRFLAHKAIWLGVAADLTISGPAFLAALLLGADVPGPFFHRFGFSFLQNHHPSASSIP